MKDKCSEAVCFKDKTITTSSFIKDMEYEIQEVIYIEKNKIFLVLYDMDNYTKKWGQFPNIVALSNEGKKIWTVELPTTNTGDSYYQMAIKDGKLIADSWCSYSCEIDISTGKITNKTFLK